MAPTFRPPGSCDEKNFGNRVRGHQGRPQSWTALTSRPPWRADATPNADAEVERLEICNIGMTILIYITKLASL